MIRTWLDHFGFGGQIEPNLKESQGIRLFRVQEWEHFRVYHTLSSRHPLQISVAVPPRVPQRISMVNDPINGGRDGFKAPMRMLGKPRYLFTMIHAVGRGGVEIRSVAPSGRLQVSVGRRRILILVVNAKQKWIHCRHGAWRKFLCTQYG